MKIFDPYDHYAACWVTLSFLPHVTVAKAHVALSNLRNDLAALLMSGVKNHSCPYRKHDCQPSNDNTKGSCTIHSQ